jgi:hypothetical protein
MKSLQVLLFAWVLIFTWACSKPETVSQTAINPVLGDKSFKEIFGRAPDPQTDEKLRIETHLAYVENLLRHKPDSHLSPGQKVKRTFLLDNLRSYRAAGIFPGNYDFPEERKPCFIDKNGNICAVGFLIEQTAGRAFAEQINEQFQYATIWEMQLPEISAWAQENGLTLEECAIIQPTYGPQPVYSYNHIPPKYGAASAVLGGANLSFTVLNTMQLAKGEGTKLAPLLGILTGASSVCLGVANLENESNWYSLTGTNETKKALSFANIGLGTATLFLSTWNLLSDHPKKEKKLTWNLYNFPTKTQEMGVGAGFTRKF